MLTGLCVPKVLSMLGLNIAAPKTWVVQDGAVTLACLVCLGSRLYLKHRGHGGGGLTGRAVAAGSGATTCLGGSGEKLGS